jgi:hypothetical protein
VQPPTEDDLQAKDLIDQPKDNSDIARRTFIAILSQGRNMTLREYLCSIPFALFSPLGQDIFQIGYEFGFLAGIAKACDHYDHASMPANRARIGSERVTGPAAGEHCA